jgi:hypothetical protein
VNVTLHNGVDFAVARSQECPARAFHLSLRLDQSDCRDIPADAVRQALNLSPIPD